MKKLFSKLGFKKPQIPKHAKWSLAIVGILAGLAAVVYFGFGIFAVAFLGAVLIGAYWPVMVAYIIAGAVIGSLVANKSSKPIVSGLSAGVFYALLTLLVAVVAIAIKMATQLS